MKTLKHRVAVSCTCTVTGITGDFLIDVDHFKNTGDFKSLEGKVFDSLVDLFQYANSKGLPTGKLPKPVTWSA